MTSGTLTEPDLLNEVGNMLYDRVEPALPVATLKHIEEITRGNVGQNPGELAVIEPMTHGVEQPVFSPTQEISPQAAKRLFIEALPVREGAAGEGHQERENL